MATSATTAAPVFDRETLLAAARERTGLSDFGDTWFFEPMDQYIAAANAEGKLTEAGFGGQTESILKGLASRLRMVEDIKQHPEILDEPVEVAAIILGLPRTGSTIFHRLLASAPGMTAIRWYEAQNYAPLPGDEPGNPKARRAYAEAMIEGWLNLSPELASIHPLDPEAPDEEIIILGQLFITTMVEAMTFIPSFAKWLDTYDQSKGYEDLKTILKYLQWQDPTRRGKKWVLKSPQNLPYTDVIANAFPKAVLVMTHRDPLEVVPSYVSMEAALYKLNSVHSDEAVGGFWFPRLAGWMKRFEEARARIGEDRFIDIDYREVAKEPLKQAQRVLAHIGVPLDDQIEAALTEFMAGNKREQRPMHDYSLERFGLNEADVRDAFASYRARYIR
ncbi:MAG: sulfotransferase family protein [Novosphingobium sp. 17-62-19]|uniref:sulfotransferase family protein n=1 Tax=Novosphingobium sp. 17-62-19 TaxID=1970406 RepID=UPI000BD803B3|nr:sulfotransferase [Novosphingobium sp. 17-62-19]OYX94832.1 MAG: sulfotransferase family protein [Novosphingobium sp. 35-62-5]OZA21784.1 MAG: sulfotransferase family protein [Novosphingobium sp. 17-62-19]HQS94911.1 sulfotransferase [Novosphingobium sp.]